MSSRLPAPVISLRSVSKSFDGRKVVGEVTFAVERGVCFGLLGPNGAGKSTTLKMIYGFFRPDAGTITVNGTDVVHEPRKVRTMLGIAPQDDLLDSDLSAFQNLIFHARYHGMTMAKSRRICRESLRESGIENYAEAPIRHLSTGVRRRLVLARALLNGSEILILDEPTRGLDRESRQGFLETLQRIKAAGTTLVLATHDLTEAEALCDRAALMENGLIRAEGPVWETLSAYRGGLAPSPPGMETPC